MSVMLLIIHVYILIELYKWRVSTCIICTLYDMYAHLTLDLPDRTIIEIKSNYSPISIFLF